MSETILITGSRGFIGRNIAESFKDKFQIIGPTHNELDLLKKEQVDSFFRENSVDYVIHTANVGGNRTSTDGPEVVLKNLRMFFNLVENEEHFKKMINLGSGAEYSKNDMGPRVKETVFGKNIPQDYYGFSKYLISKYIEKTDNIYCLRLFGVFGPFEDYRYKFISNSIVKNILQMPITIMQNVYFDWLYIEDLMNIIQYFIKNNPENNIFNLTSGKVTDIYSIAQMINDFSDFKSEINVKNHGLNQEYSGNNEKLVAELGNYNFINMEIALQKLIHYYKANIDNLDLDTVKKDPYASRCKIKQP